MFLVTINYIKGVEVAPFLKRSHSAISFLPVTKQVGDIHYKSEWISIKEAINLRKKGVHKVNKKFLMYFYY